MDQYDRYSSEILQWDIRSTGGDFLAGVLPVYQSPVHQLLQSVLPVGTESSVAVHLPLLLQPQSQPHLIDGGRGRGRIRERVRGRVALDALKKIGHGGVEKF